jgi:hypothetical protein
MNAAFKAAIERLASAMVAETDLHGGDPSYDWRAFAAKAISELPPNQQFEIQRSNESTFSRALWRAALRKETMKVQPWWCGLV